MTDITEFPISTRKVDFQKIIDAEGFSQDAEAARDQAASSAELAQANANDAKVYASEGDLPAVTTEDNGTWARVLVDSGVQAWLVVSGSWAFQAWLETPHFDTVTDFISSTDTFTAGTYVRTDAEGFAYRAVDTATSTTVANAGGQLFERLTPATWYVDSESGDDSSDGLTAYTAKATLTAVASLVADGDRVALRRNSVWRERPDFSVSSGCEFFAYSGGKRPIISGKDVASGFTIHGTGPAYTTTITLPTMPVGNRGYLGVFEDGLRLIEVIVGDSGIADEAAAIAEVESRPGTFYFAGPGDHQSGWSAGSKTYYVHASDGGDPGSNGKTYELYARERAAWLGSNVWRNIVFDAGYHHDGLNTGGGTGGATLKSCAHVNIARHGSLFGEATFEDMEIIGTNPRYGGGSYHSNPGPENPVGFHTVKGTRIVGDPRGTARNSAFFTHGDGGDTVQKDGWIIEDAEASVMSSALGADGEVGVVYANRCRFFDFTSITGGGTPINGLFVRDSEFWMRERPTGTSRAIQVSSGSQMLLDNCYLDVFDTQIQSNPAGTTAGPLTVDASTVVMHTVTKAGNIISFFRSEGMGASDVLGGLYLHDSVLYCRNVTEFAGYLARAGAIDNLEVRDVLIIGMLDPLLSVGNTDTPITDLDADARYVAVSPERVIASEETDERIRLKAGAWLPGDPIVSGAAYSYGGATQPRRTIAVGDKIWRIDRGNWARAELDAPSDHLNAVCFVNTGNTTRSFVAVGDNGAIYSTDEIGKNPTAKTSGVTDNLRAVTAHTDGTVLAVGDDGSVLKSTDEGDTWTEITSGTTKHLYGVATNGTTWIAVGQDGTVGTSTDAGATWSWGTQQSDTYRAAIWHEGLSLFVIAGDEGRLRTSPSTISWTDRATLTEQRISCLAETPEGFGESGGVVAGIHQTRPSSAPSFIVSGDGVTWEPHPQQLPFNVRAISSVVERVFASRVPIAVGASASIATGYYGLASGEPWSVKRVFDTDGTEDAKFDLSHALRMVR